MNIQSVTVSYKYIYILNFIKAFLKTYFRFKRGTSELHLDEGCEQSHSKRHTLLSVWGLKPLPRRDTPPTPHARPDDTRGHHVLSSAEKAPSTSSRKRGRCREAGDWSPQATRPLPCLHRPRSPEEVPSVATCVPQNGGDRGHAAGRAPSTYYLTLFGEGMPTSGTGEEENPKQSRMGVFKNKNVTFPY